MASLRAPTFAAIFFAAAASASAEQVSADFLAPIRPLTHAGSGFLHSITTTTPPNNLLVPLQPQLFRSYPEGGNSGVFPTYNRAQTLGAKSQLVVSDAYSYETSLPGDGGDWTAWESLCREIVNHAKAEGKVFQYDIWNEPDIPYFWSRTKEQWLETWKRGVQAIRAVDPAATIVGPSTAIYYNTDIPMGDFLTYARDNNVLPNVISWHNFSGAVTNEVADFRARSAALGININRISLNEIVYQTDIFKPGIMPRFFGEIERNGIESAARACWDESPGVNSCFNDSLDGLLTNDTKQPRSTWWTYERYGEMAGTSVSTVQSDTLDSVASYKTGAAYVLVGRFGVPANGNAAQLILNNLDDVPNLIVDGRVHVLAERIVDSASAASAGPVATINANFSLVGGQLILSLPNFNSYDVYFVRLVAPLAGDFNGDRIVDAADYVVWRTTDGTATGFDQWRAHFGQSLPNGADAAVSVPVPEPADFVTLLIGILLLGSATRPTLAFR